LYGNDKLVNEEPKGLLSPNPYGDAGHNLTADNFFLRLILFTFCNKRNIITILIHRFFVFAIFTYYFRCPKGSIVFDVIFGPAYKGISLGAVVCATLYSEYNIDVDYAYNRKEEKDHGEGGKLVGASMKDKRVLVIDDVITAGTAIRESYSMLSHINAQTVGVVIALDRAEKRALDDPVSAVQAVARDLSIPVVSIVSLPQLQNFLNVNPDYGEDIINSVSKYRAAYGV